MFQDTIFYDNNDEGASSSQRTNNNLRHRNWGLENDTNTILEESACIGGEPTREFENLDPADKEPFDSCKPPSVMEMLRNFNPVEPPTSGDPEELQLWLECFSQRETVVRHQNLLKKARDRKAFDSMSAMQRHVVQWFTGLRDTIEIRQKEFLSNQDKRRASNRYGPLLCSLHPDKMAVLLSQEAIIQALLFSGKDGKHGISVVKLSKAIGSAVETEVVSQRRMKERFQKPNSPSKLSDDDDEDVSGEDNDNDNSNNIENQQDGIKSLEEADKEAEFSMDRWSFGASHVKLFFDDFQRLGMGKNKKTLRFAMKRAKQATNSSDTWTSDDLTHLGAALLSILTEHAMVNENGREHPAFQIEKVWTSKGEKSQSFVKIHQGIYRLFVEDDYFSWAAITSRHMPMIVPPSNWTGPHTGGYRWLESNMMRTHRSNVQKEALQHADLSTICDGLNVLGKVPWKINKEILEVVEYCWDNDIPIGDIPSRTDLDVPSEPVYPAMTFDPDMYANKDHPETKEKIKLIESYRDKKAKYHRILQKNLVCILLMCFFSQRTNFHFKKKYLTFQFNLSRRNF